MQNLSHSPFRVAKNHFRGLEGHLRALSWHILVCAMRGKREPAKEFRLPLYKDPIGGQGNSTPAYYRYFLLPVTESQVYVKGARCKKQILQAMP